MMAAGAIPNLYWNALSMEELRSCERYVPLPPGGGVVGEPASYRCVGRLSLRRLLPHSPTCGLPRAVVRHFCAS
jgi:hypothetical protein